MLNIGIHMQNSITLARTTPLALHPSLAAVRLMRSRILKDFYSDEANDARPRIFSMTASPIDAKTDVALAAHELETILHSRIATTQDMSLTNAVKKPDEHILSKIPARAASLSDKLFHSTSRTDANRFAYDSL